MTVLLFVWSGSVTQQDIYEAVIVAKLFARVESAKEQYCSWSDICICKFVYIFIYLDTLASMSADC